MHAEAEVAVALGLYVPAEQLVQVVAFVAPMAVLYVPAGHDMHTPDVEYVPAGQSLLQTDTDVAPDTVLYLPAGQAAHPAEVVHPVPPTPYVPTEQLVHRGWPANPL